METRSIFTDTIQPKGENIIGYAAIFNSPTQLYFSDGKKQFREVIRPNAFSNLKSDVKCFLNHNRDKLLGRTNSGTLKIWQDQKGLAFDLQIPKFARKKLAEQIERGDLKGCSFGFTIPSNGERWSNQEGMPFRELMAVDVDEISLCYDPAYTTTSCQLRSIAPNFFAYELKLKEIYINNIKL